MSAVQALSSNAEVIDKHYALQMNVAAAIALKRLLESNLGPCGTLKMLVSGAGAIKLTKDGQILLNEMSILNPTAQMIARSATALDDNVGDGTTSVVLVVGEILRIAFEYCMEGAPPQSLVEGIEKAKVAASAYIEKSLAIPIDGFKDRSLLVQVAKSVVGTKVDKSFSDQLADIIVSAVECISRNADVELDLHMVELIHMKHRAAHDTRFVPGLVMDHGFRDLNMEKANRNVFIVVLNVSLEYEKSEVNSSFFYATAEQRTKLARAERDHTKCRVQAVVDFKHRVFESLKKEGKKAEEHSFLVVNHKGIDPLSLDLLCKNGIIALRRCKRRNMERLVKACGGYAVNVLDELQPECLGFAGSVKEVTLSEEKYTFIEQVKNPTSCTILIKGSNDHTIARTKQAIRDGLRAVRNAVLDKAVLAGGGNTEILVGDYLEKEVKETVTGRAQLGVEAVSKALLVIPKLLAHNASYDKQESLIKLQAAVRGGIKHAGLDMKTGEAVDMVDVGIYDLVRAKKHLIHSACVICQQLLLVDEIIKAGRDLSKKE